MHLFLGVGTLREIDLNCDLGEGFGVYTLGNDHELLNEVSSANIACGFHAGDPMTMRATVRQCLEKNVAIGAHPGFPDLIGFGRREMNVAADEVYALVLYQMGALKAIAEAEGGRLHHVKPHGALYHMACRERELAIAVAEAVYKLDPGLILYGLPGSELITAGLELGLYCAGEGFIDRRYMSDRSLASRALPGSSIDCIDTALDQAVKLATGQAIPSLEGALISIDAATLCIHGDGPKALELAKAVKRRLIAEGFIIRPVGAE